MLPMSKYKNHNDNFVYIHPKSDDVLLRSIASEYKQRTKRPKCFAYNYVRDESVYNAMA